MACLLTRPRLKQANNLKPVIHIHTSIELNVSMIEHYSSIVIGDLCSSFHVRCLQLVLKPHKEALNNSTSPVHKKQSKCTLFKPIFLYGGESSTRKSREPIHHLTEMAGQHTLFIRVNV